MSSDLPLELLGEARVLRFAMREWEQLYETAGKALPLDRIVLGTWEQLRQAEPERSVAIAGKLAEARYEDEFVIARQGDGVYLIGSSERAALYAVYQFAELALGLHWIFPGQPPVRRDSASACAAISSDSWDSPDFSIASSLHYAPVLERRGFVFETIEDAPFMQAMVDWLAKNKINEIFFTFTLWDKIGQELQEPIADRGLAVTLGGHSASFFLHRQAAATETNADHPYTAKKQLDYTDGSWQPGFIRQIADYCRSVRDLKRISLWPEDIKHQQAEDFLTPYIAFNERLKEELLQSGLLLEVEHIAYNAGLAWDMLELREQPSTDIDTLYAYWGRDYRFGLGKGESASDQRAYTALQMWRQQLESSGRKLTVFEYYSDHFMLSPLFPMLAKRIVEDIRSYAEAGVYGMTNLVVPCREEGYPYQWNQTFNSYVFARALWNDSLDEIEQQFAAAFAGELQPHVLKLYEQLEEETAVLTKWNVPLFPARAVDPVKAVSCTEDEKEQVLAQLDRIIALAERYLAKLESTEAMAGAAAAGKAAGAGKASQRLQLGQTLVHYASYARRIKQQWLSLILNEGKT
ncbi:hypothetical protein COLU111180_13525 [Cohnella lubricantis]|uniref:Alpha glucuronidase N-terminal domain-containing protein n=1 Tax=Cohnella lubricantis TaxID=2163172 RepID=A0A841TA24_9BACL|nr:hypothetical protein [Cohnella lubricantis]MBB6675887.1 hypothetical protein [Cohnella lubricantis]MBP2117196.1 hypothetical protein [Cohnella lubricantis]